MKITFATLLFMVSSLAQAQYQELPFCEVEGYSMECRRAYSTVREVRYVPGCAISCPADKSPLCQAGVVTNDCDEPLKMPVCKCE